MRRKTRRILLASAARTATTNSAEMNGARCRALIMTVEVTAYGGAGSITPKLQGITPAGTAYDLISGTAIAATGVFVYQVSPDGLTAGAGVTKVAQVEVPTLYRASMVAADATTHTYSVTIEEV